MHALLISHANIGDAILSTVLLRKLRENYPHATVDVVAGPRAMEIFEGAPNLQRLIPLVKQKHHKHYVTLWKALKNTPYDLVIDLRTPFLSYALKAKKRLIFSPLFPEKSKHTSRFAPMHKIEHLADLWTNADLPDRTGLARPEIFIPAPIQEEVAAKLKEIAPSQQPVIAIAPTANWIGKQWPQKNFAELIPLLEGQNPSLQKAVYLIFGAAHEEKSVGDFVASLPQNRTHNLIGKTSLLQAGAWLKNATVFIGNDSGLAHLAAAVGTPTVTLFGPTNESIYAPVSAYNPDHSRLVLAPVRPISDLNLEPEARPRLITDISPQAVAQAVTNLLSDLNLENQTAKTHTKH